jgi:hypothetical protein
MNKRESHRMHLLRASIISFVFANSTAAPDSHDQISARTCKTPKHFLCLLRSGETGASVDDNDFVSQMGEGPNPRSQSNGRLPLSCLTKRPYGGSQLDSVTSTIRALPKVVEAVEGKVPVFMDGGIRSGLDVLKALALGAKACFLGRAWAYALGAAGESGVRDMLDIVREELRVAMILTGCSDVSRATSDLLLKDLTHAAA